MSPGRPRRGRDRHRPGEGPDRLGAVLAALSSEPSWIDGMRLGDLGRRWPEAVGERLAAESAPIGLAGGELVVRATSGAWGAQVRFLAPQIRDRANELLGVSAVRAVRVVGDAGPPSPR